MAFQDTVQTTVRLGTTSVTEANLGSTLFVTANSYFSERLRAYNSFQEVKDDDAIPTDSNAYNALRLGFSATGCATPLYLGRRQVDKTTLTPDPDKIGVASSYSLTVTTGDETVTATYVSGTGDDAQVILDDLESTITGSSTTVTATVVGTGSAAVLEIVPSSTDTVVIDAVSNLPQTFETTESAADLLTAITDEDDESWYFFLCEDQSEAFILSCAAEIQSTSNSNHPKMYFFSTSDVNALVSLPDPAIDILGKLKELGYNRTSGQWHDEASTLFPEIYGTCFKGSIQPGASTWKFIIPSGISAAADPSTGKRLTTGKQGFIGDRNGNWYGYDRGQTYHREGTVADGEWIDTIRGRDWLVDTIEVNLLNLLLNQPTGKIPFTSAGKALVKNTIDSVLAEGVDLGFLSGYEATTIPTDTPFADQASRILQDVEFSAYLSGAVHTIIVDGVLTYSEEELS